MEYVSSTKCTFIGEKHAIFDVTIVKDTYKKGETNVVCEGNIIINEQLDYTYEYTISGDKNYDNITAIKNELESAVEKCNEKAKWIFYKNKNNDKN